MLSQTKIHVHVNYVCTAVAHNKTKEKTRNFSADKKVGDLQFDLWLHNIK